jgi:hypothetical protein
VAGKDASKQFWKYHNEGILKKYKGQLQVGSLDSKKQAPPTPPATPPPQKEAVKAKAGSGTVSAVPGKAAKIEALDPFGDLVPYGDPSWYQTVGMPFPCDSHPADISLVPLALLHRNPRCASTRGSSLG